MIYETDNSSSYPFHPWRRYFARMLDMLIYSIIWTAFLAFVFHVNVSDRSGIDGILDTLVELIMMLFLEPLLLHVYGTTPGKFIFGLRIDNKESEHLSYAEGLERTFSMIGTGMGFNIPIYNLICYWKSYRICSENEILPWDEYTSYKIKDTSWYRGCLYIVSYFICFAVIAAIMSAQLIPPNKGDLTVAEFSENYNYYARILDIDFGDKYLDEKGEWQKKETDSHIIHIGLNKDPEFHFTTNDGYVTEVSFTVDAENNNGFVSTYHEHMFLSSLSLACAQDEMSLFSRMPKRIENAIKNNLFNDFSFTEAGINFVCDVEYSGYIKTQSQLMFPSNAEENYFSLKYTMNKQNR